MLLPEHFWLCIFIATLMFCTNALWLQWQHDQIVCLSRTLVHILVRHADGQGIFRMSAAAFMTMLQSAS